MAATARGRRETRSTSLEPQQRWVCSGGSIHSSGIRLSSDWEGHDRGAVGRLRVERRPAAELIDRLDADSWLRGSAGSAARNTRLRD